MAERDVWILGASMTKFGRYPDKDLIDLGAEAALAALDGSGTWSMLFHNLAWTVPGNIVGGALVVGGSYAWLGSKTRTPEPATPVPAEQSPNGQDLEPVPVA